MSLLPEVLTVIICSSIAAWIFRLPLGPTVAAGFPIKVALDVFREHDSEINLRFFDIDSGFDMKLAIAMSLIYAIEGLREKF